MAVDEGFAEATTAGLFVGARTGPTVGILSLFPNPVNTVLKFAKFMDPNPVTGSHPLEVENPDVQQKDDDVHLLLPTVISFAKELLYLYKVGLIQPRPPLPIDTRAAFTKDTIPNECMEVFLTIFRTKRVFKVQNIRSNQKK